MKSFKAFTCLFLSSFLFLEVTEGFLLKHTFHALSDMIKETTKRDPNTYLDYGCFCGLGKDGFPVDATDQCCYDHEQDLIYSGIVFPKIKVYHSISFLGEVTCFDIPGTELRRICEIDKKLALCLAQQVFNPANMKFSQFNCKKMEKQQKGKKRKQGKAETDIQELEENIDEETEVAKADETTEVAKVDEATEVAKVDEVTEVAKVDAVTE